LLLIAQLAKCDSSCDCPIQNNYDQGYEQGYQERVCASSNINIWFHNKCWLDEFNLIHDAGLSIVPGSNCPHDESQPCIFLCVTTYNPICAFNRLTGTTQTFQNLCNYRCQNGGK
ncbi:unnamed protein product, partial [Allacma fusca]